jgi:hypothetical protein
VRAMRRDGADAAFAVDGPRGPRGVVKGGAIVAARAAGAVLVPMAGLVRRGIVLRRTWDRFAIAWPFTRVDVALGDPVDPRTATDARADVERSLARLNAGLSIARGGDRVDLHEGAAGQSRDLDGDSSGVGGREEPRVHLVDGREVREVDEVDRRARHVAE